MASMTKVESKYEMYTQLDSWIYVVIAMYFMFRGYSVHHTNLSKGNLIIFVCLVTKIS